MRFLIAFAAVFGYAFAGVIASLVFNTNEGDVQAATIDATIAAEDHARALDERQLYALEDMLRAKNKAMREAADNSQHLQETAYWRSVVDSQNYVAAAQSQAAALSGAAAAVRAAPVVPTVAPLTYADYGLPAAYGLGLHAW